MAGQSPEIIEWYTHKVADIESYINGAFRSNRNGDEVYLFMKNEYVVLNYVEDKLVGFDQPILIKKGFPSLAKTPFGEYGVGGAFGYHNKDEAFISFGNLCADLNYASPSEPIRAAPIYGMFPFFKNTVFQNGIDAAFESKAVNETYLFRGDQYAVINYAEPALIATGKITDGLKCLKGTVFENGIDAAFASSKKDEAYLLKGDKSVLINFADDCIIGDVKLILSNWPSLNSILPRKNRGVSGV